MMNEPSILAIVSIILYLSLGMTSAYYFHRLSVRMRNNKVKLMQQTIGIKFNESKQIFFLIMTVSAILDIPLYIGCLVNNGPQDCEWDDYQYTAYFLMHLISLCGYFICLGIPLFLWSDVIGSREGHVESNFTQFDTKRFLFVSISCYMALQIVRVIALFLDADITSHIDYQHNELHAITSCLEPIFIVIISAIWLWCGVRLQIYVMKVCFHPEAERKILAIINLVMLAILVSYLLRAVFVLSLFLEETFAITIDYNFIWWILCTRWVPYIFCSFLLIFIMRRSIESSAPTPNVSEKDTGSLLGGVSGRSSHDRGTKRSSGKKTRAASYNNGQILSDSEEQSIGSRDSFAIYVADYEASAVGGADLDGSSFSPLSSFSSIMAVDMSGLGTPLLLSSASPPIRPSSSLSASNSAAALSAAAAAASPTTSATSTTAATATTTTAASSSSAKVGPSNNSGPSPNTINRPNRVVFPRSSSLGSSVSYRPAGIQSKGIADPTTRMSLSEAYADDYFSGDDRTEQSSPLLKRALTLNPDNFSLSAPP